jgi:hypothetical protein
MRRITASLVLLTVLAPNVRAQDGNVSPVVSAARERQDAMRTITFVYRMKETTEAGAISTENGRSDQKVAIFPETRKSFESLNRLVFDGERIRHEDNHPTPDARTKGWVDTATLMVTDGSIVKKLHHPASGPTRQNAIAKISSPKRTSIADLAMLIPFHMCCRGIDNPGCKNSFIYPPLQPTSIRLRIAGVEVIEYNHPTFPTIRFWVEANQSYSVRRIRYQTPDANIQYQTDIAYEKSAVTGHWMPSNWTHTAFDDKGRVTRTFAIAVESVSVDSKPSDSEFDLQFPPGLQVYDQRDGSWSLVRDDGTLLNVAGATVDSDDVRSSLQSTWWGRNWWWLTLTTAAGSFLIGVVVNRIRARRHARSSTPSASPPSADTQQS